MPILNEDIDVNSLPASVRDSFKFEPEKRLYVPGTQFIRLVTLGHTSFSGAFCITQDCYDNILRYSKTFGVDVHIAAKETLALLTKFSPRPNLSVKTTIGQHVYGFEGPAAPQADTKSNESFSGGFRQIFIPNLSGDHSRKVGVISRL